MTRKTVYIVDGTRTTFLKAPGKTGPFSAAELAIAAGRELFKRVAIDPALVEEVVLGCAMPSPHEANIGRIVALRLGCGNKTPGYTEHRNCASGLQALDSAVKDIMLGRHDIVLAGGVDAMSRAPVLFSDKMVNWLADWYKAKTFGQRVKTLRQFKLNYLAPVVALLYGLTDPVCGLNMGQTAENVAFKFNISRDEMDQFALESHHRLAAAYEAGYMNEVVPLYDTKGNAYDVDTGLRKDTTLEKLAKLKPIFDKPYGNVTPGNSSQVTDGAVTLLLASEEAVKKHNLPVLGKVVDVEWAGCEPAYMGLGPVYSATPILTRHNLTLNDIDYWEINEAFAAQVLGCLKAWENKDFCQKELGLTDALGSLDRTRLNVDGGAIALGHPIGASGGRIVLHLLNVLKRKEARYGIASICIGGGQGGAILVERVDAVK